MMMVVELLIKYSYLFFISLFIYIISASRKGLKLSGALTNSTSPLGQSGLHSGGNSSSNLLNSTTSVGGEHSMTVRALMRDLKTILKEPLPLVSALPLDDNIFVWHCNLKGFFLLICISTLFVI
jgi:hypothetical protein